MTYVVANIFSEFSSNYEASASELLTNLAEVFILATGTYFSASSSACGLIDTLCFNTGIVSLIL